MENAEALNSEASSKRLMCQASASKGAMVENLRPVLGYEGKPNPPSSLLALYYAKDALPGAHGYAHARSPGSRVRGSTHVHPEARLHCSKSIPWLGKGRAGRNTAHRALSP